MVAAWPRSKALAVNPRSPGQGFDVQLEEVRAGHLTGVFNGNGAAMARQMQTVAVRESRLGIPLIFAADVIHGFRTIFPVPLAEAASWDPQLSERTHRVAATEAAAAGIDWACAPMMDIARDPRRGRGVEGAGEDVLLGRRLAAARVRGIQGLRLSDPDAMLACAKHLAAYGAAEGGLDYNGADISERTLREVYFPPFAAALEAGAQSVMAAFNDLSGIPATANRWLMSDVLRREWGFTGLVVSDYEGDRELVAHGFAADEREATRLAFLAGVDMSMQSGLYLRHLPGLVAAGEVPMARLNEAVGRVLAVKAKLGLLDDPFRRIDVRRELTVTARPAHRRLAREAATRSVVLLQNRGDLLPLDNGARIALIGPFAEGAHDLVGPWTVYGDDEDAIDLASGLRAAARSPGLIRVARGSDVDAPLPGGIDAALSAARAADVIVLAIGESAAMSGEAQSVASPTVPDAQIALAEALAATGKPMVVILKNGRALALKTVVREASAVLVGWFLDSETGNALADVIYGRISPSGRLPVSFPGEPGQVPYTYAHKSTGRPNPAGPLEPYKAHYRGIANSAAYPFGHGLTYGRMEYATLRHEAQLDWDVTLTVEAEVRNAGPRAAVEVVQLYIRDLAGSVTRPVQELKDWRRVALAAGETRTVSFTLTPHDLAFVGIDHRPTVEPGNFTLWVAPSSEVDGLRGTFTLLGPAGQPRPAAPNAPNEPIPAR